MMKMPDFVSCPRLRHLRTNAPVAVTSSNLEDVHLDLSIDHIFSILSTSPTIRTLTIGSNAFVPNTLQDYPEIALPVCRSVTVLVDVDETAVALFKSIKIPSVTHISLKLDVREFRYAVPVLGTGDLIPEEDDCPPCCCRTISRHQMRIHTDNMFTLSPVLQSIL